MKLDILWDVYFAWERSRLSHRVLRLGLTKGGSSLMKISQPYDQSPPVWKWYIVYCILMAILYLITTLFGLGFLLLGPEAPDMTETEARVMGFIFLIFSLPLLVIFALAPFLPKKPWVWIYGLVLIALGMTSMCCLPATIPLLIFWIKPETRQFFGRS